jgi:hypothetical protein
MGTSSFPGIKRPGCGVDHPPPSSAVVKEYINACTSGRLMCDECRLIISTSPLLCLHLTASAPHSCLTACYFISKTSGPSLVTCRAVHCLLSAFHFPVGHCHSVTAVRCASEQSPIPVTQLLQSDVPQNRAQSPLRTAFFVFWSQCLFLTSSSSLP